MSMEFIENQVKEGIVDFSVLAIEQDDTVDEIEHSIFILYEKDNFMPVVTNSIRRLFPTYLEYKFPATFSTEARVALSGILFGLKISEGLPVDNDAVKYMVSQDLATIRNAEEFYNIGYSCLGDIDFITEAIPRISLAEVPKFELELSAGFGLVISNSLEAYQHQYLAQ